MRCFDFLFGDNPNRALWGQSGPVAAFLLLQTVPEDIDLVVEVLFQTVFELDPFAVGVRWDSKVE